MKKCIMLVFILTVGMFSIVGCGDRTTKSNASDADGAYFSNNEEKKQFTEIITASGETIGIIDNNKEIERFVKQLDIESWNYMEQLPEDIDLVYSYISYEVIDEAVFLQDGIPLVNKSTLEFYISSKGEYIIRDYNQEIEAISLSISPFGT